MARVKYKEEEIMPIVISVLHHMMLDLYLSAYKIALQTAYTDLAEFVNPEELDQEAIYLVEALDDPLTLLIRQCTADISNCVRPFEIIHNYDIREFEENTSLAAKANSFYWRLSFYCTVGGRTKGARGDLYRYTFCIDHIFYHLCRLIIFQYREVTGYTRKRYIELKKVDFKVLDQYEQNEVRMLVDLAAKLDVTCDKIVEIVGKGRRKRKVIL